MLWIYDLKQDDAGDLILENGDFIIEDDGYKSAIITAENRANARTDDFILDSCAAGLESLLYKNLEKSKYDIEYQLRNCLLKDNLFSSGDFDIKILSDNDNKTSQVFVKIKSNNTTSNGFRVIIDQLQNSSYRS